MNFKKEQNEAEIATINLGELLRILWIQKWMIAIIMAVFFICALCFLIFKSPLYQPSALIQVDNPSNNNTLPNMSQNARALMGVGTLGRQASQAQIEMTLMQSAYILKPTIDKLNLDVEITPHYFPVVGRYFSRTYSGSGVAPAKLGLSSFAWGGESWSLAYFSVPFADYNRNFKVRVGENQSYQLFSPSGRLLLTGLVGQSAMSQDGSVQLLWNRLNARPGEVIYLKKLSLTPILQSLAKNLQITELSPASTVGVSMVLSDTGIIQLGLKSAHPAEAVRILNTILTLTLKDNLNQKEKSASKTLDFIRKQLPIAMRSMTEAQTELSQQEQKTGIISLQGQSAALLQELSILNGQVITAAATQAQYQQLYTAQNPVMQNVNAQIISLEQQKALLEQQVASLPLRDQKNINLMQDAAVKRQIYASLLESEQQYELAKASALSDVRILDFASVPDTSLPEYGILILLVSLLGGFVVGALIVLGRHQLKNVVSDPYWTEREFGIRTVSILPFSSAQTKAQEGHDIRQSSAIPILAVNQPHDPFVESIRSLRTSLFFTFKEKQSNIVNITGVIPQTGKSLIATNLAVVLAQTGKRVILIDADMRRGYLNRAFKKPLSPGLSGVLRGVQSLKEAVVMTGIENLDFLATGIYPENPSELLLSPTFKETLAVLSADYDIVVIDGPPILAVNDASIIAKEVLVNYLVIPSGELKPQEIEAAIRRFHTDGVILSGALFNYVKANVQKMSNNAYHYDYYSRYYKKECTQQKQQ